MATHINAYFEDVENAKAEVKSAQAKLDTAKVALEAKKKEVGFVEETQPQEEPAKQEESKPLFKKK